MHALPPITSLVCALAIAPALLRGLARGGAVAANYRGRSLPFPFGLLVPITALVVGVPLLLVSRLDGVGLFHPEAGAIAIYALGVTGLGLIDDAIADRPARGGVVRGVRGHLAAVLRGELSTGLLKAVGSVAFALLALAQLGMAPSRWPLAVAVLVLATHAMNLLDLRPGRAIKAFILIGAGLTVFAGSLRALFSLGLLGAPALVAGGYDLRERAMLGDTGSNLLGALAGLWLVLTLSSGEQLAALALLCILTLYGEVRSISRLIERTPGLRRLDSVGRPS
jgi:UDP-GlcNAc:undecaprenyl-phosphate/decaprenyl-phosphate GlcNAc-1-phosphate transferase